jgi:hypothetical protein
MLMAKSAEGGVYNPCLFGAVEGASLDAEPSVTVFRPMTTTMKDFDYTSGWLAGEHVSLRLASIDRRVFDFWSAFMNDVINAHNPVWPSAVNLPSNIEGGGLGIWYGFSADYGTADIPE